MCQLNNGELGGCTEMYCFTRNMPSCEVYEPEVSIMPVIDPLPPVINPFLPSVGDGH